MKNKHYWVPLQVHAWGQLKHNDSPIVVIGDNTPCGWIAVFTNKKVAKKWAGRKVKLMRFQVVK